jgi:hypothetical protein
MDDDVYNNITVDIETDPDQPIERRRVHGLFCGECLVVLVADIDAAMVLPYKDGPKGEDLAG